MLGLEDVEPLPVPKSPAMMQEMPSVKMPLGNKHGRAGAHPTLLQHPWDGAVRVRYRGGEKEPAVPVNGVHRGRGGSCQPGTGVVVPDGLDDARQRGAEHAQHGC